jgi:hypothetical protein
MIDTLQLSAKGGTFKRLNEANHSVNRLADRLMTFTSIAKGRVTRITMMFAVPDDDEILRVQRLL